MMEKLGSKCEEGHNSTCVVEKVDCGKAFGSKLDGGAKANVVIGDLIPNNGGAHGAQTIVTGGLLAVGSHKK